MCSWVIRLEELSFKQYHIIILSWLLVHPKTECKSSILEMLITLRRSPIAPHLGFLAYTTTSYGLIAEKYKKDWKYVRKMINDRKFQEDFKNDAIASSKE